MERRPSSIRLPKKYPEMFALQEEYTDPKTKKTIPLLHKKKVKEILIYLHEKMQPILKKFNLSYALLTESPLSHSKTATTQKIKIRMGTAKEPWDTYTHHIQLKIRDLSSPNNTSLFLNKTTLLAIFLHELAHLSFPGHQADFALFLRTLYHFAFSLKDFEEKGEHQQPSVRRWERKIYETRGEVEEEELKRMVEEEDKALSFIVNFKEKLMGKEQTEANENGREKKG